MKNALPSFWRVCLMGLRLPMGGACYETHAFCLFKNRPWRDTYPSMTWLFLEPVLLFRTWIRRLWLLLQIWEEELRGTDTKSVIVMLQCAQRVNKMFIFSSLQKETTFFFFFRQGLQIMISVSSWRSSCFLLICFIAYILFSLERKEEEMRTHLHWDDICT